MAKAERSVDCSRIENLRLVAGMLEETGYTNELRQFSRTFISMLKDELNLREDLILFLKESSHPFFQPFESSNWKIMSGNDNWKIEGNIFLQEITNEDGTKLPFLQSSDVSDEFHLSTSLQNDYILFPLIVDEETIGVVMVLMKSDDEDYLTRVYDIAEISTLLSPWFKRLLDYREMMIEKQRKELLLKVNRKFYSSMDVNGILKEILHALHEAYPTFTIELLLSNDWKVAEYLSAQPLDIHDGKQNYAAEAYLTGKVLAMDLIVGKKSILYIPLKGKQGVYGVFKMTSSTSQIFKDQEIDFIQVLADTGGNAIENAELYQQSRQHISDLQLINQTSHELNANLRLEEAIDILVKKMKNAFSADEVCFLLNDKNWLGNTVQSEKEWSENIEVFSEMFLSQIKETKSEIFLSDFSINSQNSPYKSVIGIPMIHDSHIIGGLFVYGREEYAFSFDTFKLCQSLVHHSTLAFVNAMLHAEMKELITTDYLTKLYTREFMDEKVLASMNEDGFGSFILLDIDSFKEINDEYGHQSGDEVIIQVAKLIKENIKHGFDIPVRWGGEELAIYLPKTEMGDALKVAERIRRRVQLGTTPQVTVSCGVSCWSNVQGPPSVTRLFNRADKAMYKAKNAGRNTVIAFEEEDQQTIS